MGAVIDGLSNLISGGTWQQSGGELAAQNWNAEQAALARSFSAEEAAKQRDFEREMSNTAYQRAAVDMKAAGLNPYLAYQNGGASTPSGASAQTSSAGGSYHRAHGNQLSQFLSATAKIISAFTGGTDVTNNYYGVSSRRR